MIGHPKILRSDLCRWIHRLALEHMWINFIKYFTSAHTELRETDTSVDKLGYQLANNIATQIVKRLRAHTAKVDNHPHAY